jgi:predicted ArsR family transcriptional regulator
MQQTRRYILEILRERGQATVDDIVAALQLRRGNITAVTVRHHLSRLQEENLITAPELRHRETPGRPQHVYALTEQGKNVFPTNYQMLATELVKQLRQHLPPEGVNVILQGVADSIAEDAEIPDVPIMQRMDMYGYGCGLPQSARLRRPLGNPPGWLCAVYRELPLPPHRSGRRVVL